MAKITFTIPSVLNAGSGEKKTEIDAATLKESFEKISEIMGDDFKRRVLEADGSPRSLINIYINGKNAAFSDGIDTPLTDGDEIYILPAVAGGSDLSEKELDRFSRQVMLEQIGYDGQLKLKNSTVCVVGVGGLGNPITTRLAAMGVGKLRVVDRDVIELSNLHRQTMFDEDDVGQVKVEVAAKKLKKLNPEVEIEALPISVNDYTALDVIEGCDVVVDALDSVNARYSLNKACVEKNIPFVTGAAVGVTGQVFTVLPKKTACYHCLFPTLDEETMPTCSIEGVHPSILSVIGGLEVHEACDGEKGVALFREVNPDVVICDLIMPGQHGYQTITEIKRMDLQVKIIAMSGGTPRRGGGQIGTTPEAMLSWSSQFGADVVLQIERAIGHRLALDIHLILYGYW